MRSALLQRGNALAAQGLEEQARETYESVFPILKDEPRCARVDWERHSVYVNIGNTYARTGDFDKADEQYKIAEELGKDHIKEKGGSEDDGRSMILCAKRAYMKSCSSPILSTCSVSSAVLATFALVCESVLCAAVRSSN